MHALTRCVCAKNFKAIANCAWKIPELQKELIDMLLRKVESESTNLCTSKTSPFKAPSVESMKEFSLTEQENEVKSKSPLLWQIITAAGTNEKSIARNKRKTKESIKPALLTATATLLHSRSRHMNMNASVHSIILRRGGADKMTYKRLSKLGLCSSYGPTLTYQSNLGKDNLEIVKSWGEKENIQLPVNKTPEVAEKTDNIDHSKITLLDLGSKEGKELFFEDEHDVHDKSVNLANVHVNNEDDRIEYSSNDLAFMRAEKSKSNALDLSCSLADMTVDNDRDNLSDSIVELSDDDSNGKKTGSLMHVGYVLAGDNVNFALKVKHTSRNKGNQQKNLFNCIATKTRVPFQHHKIKDKVPKSTEPDKVPLTTFLPGKKENDVLRSEFRHRIGWTLIKYVEDVSWFKNTSQNRYHTILWNILN